jgi:hypothetical protein
VAFEDPAIRWVRAMSLVRELRDCVIIPLTDLADEWPGWDGITTPLP